MAQPTTYDRTVSFTDAQAAAPSTPLSGSNLDIELNNAKITLDEILTNLALLQRDDGTLANGTVTIDSLAADVVAGVTPATNWVTATSYSANSSFVFESNKMYQCLIAHTSGTFATDLAALKWTEVVDFTGTTFNNTSLTGVTLIDAGTAALPSLAFTGDTTTGLYRVSSNIIGVAAAGSKIAQLASTGFRMPSGTVSVPGMGFEADPDTGVYRIGANNLGIAVGGAKVIDVGAADVSVAQKLTLSKALELPDYATVASATTADIGAAAANFVNITGTTTITGLGTVAAGTFRIVKFAGALTLTHNATSLILPGSANITTAAGDIAYLKSEGSGNWRCLNYAKASGRSVAGYVQRVYAEYRTHTTGSTAIPADDTAPQSGEGTEILTASITGKSTANKFNFRITAPVGCSASAYMIAAVFQDSNASCFAATSQYLTTGTGTTALAFEFQLAVPSTSAITFKLRIGSSTGTYSVNGHNTSRLFGGMTAVVMEIEEVTA